MGNKNSEPAEKGLNKLSAKKSANSSHVEAPEIGFVIVSVGLSTIAIASGYGSPYTALK
jgi:hypothetical protein